MRYLPQPNASLPLKEKLRSGLAGGAALGVLGWALSLLLPPGPQQTLLIGSIAASAVLLFAAPHSPLAQPWNLVLGHGLSAIVGWCCSLLFIHPVLAGALAVGLSILLMHLLDSLHPPGAATALTLVLGSTQFHHAGFIWTALLVMGNVAGSLLLALLFNNMMPGRRYPAPSAPTQPPLRTADTEPEPEDLRWALSQMDGVIDVSAEDVLEAYRLAKHRATERALRH